MSNFLGGRGGSLGTSSSGKGKRKASHKPPRWGEKAKRANSGSASVRQLRHHLDHFLANLAVSPQATGTRVRVDRPTRAVYYALLCGHARGFPPQR